MHLAKFTFLISLIIIVVKLFDHYTFYRKIYSTACRKLYHGYFIKINCFNIILLEKNAIKKHRRTHTYTKELPSAMPRYVFLWLQNEKITVGSWNLPNVPPMTELYMHCYCFPEQHDYLCYHAAAAKSLQSCLTLQDPIEGSPPDSSVPGILQARILEWVAISFSKQLNKNSLKKEKTLNLDSSEICG